MSTDGARAYRHILSPEDRAANPGYARLCDELSTNVVALEIADEALSRRQNPTLILAILHYLSMRGTSALATAFDELRGSGDPDSFASVVSNWLATHSDAVRAELWRTTQTNEINRSAVFQRVIGDVARSRGEQHVALIDLGTSMGLNLYLDHYPVREHDDDNPLTITTSSLSAWFEPAPLPQLATRIGIDVNLLDPTNAEDVLWLRACLWPEQLRRRERFDAVLSSLHHWPRAQRVAGHVGDVLSDVLDSIDDQLPVYLVNSWVLAYVAADEQRALAEQIYDYAARRPLVWCSFEHPASTLELNFPSPLAPSPRPGGTQIVVTTSTRPPTHWGWCHPHGYWFEAASGPNAW